MAIKMIGEVADVDDILANGKLMWTDKGEGECVNEGEDVRAEYWSLRGMLYGIERWTDKEGNHSIVVSAEVW